MPSADAKTGLPALLNHDPAADDEGMVARLVGTIPAPAPTSGTITTYPDAAVGAAASQILATNTNRKKAIIQNTGSVNIRVGDVSISAAQGIRLTPNSVIVYDQPACPTGAIYVISEGAASTAAAQEIS